MFNRINKMKVKDIEKLHKNLKKNQFVRIFTKSGIAIDLLKEQKFEINNDYLAIDNLKTFTKDIVLYDVLTSYE